MVNTLVATAFMNFWSKLSSSSLGASKTNLENNCLASSSLRSLSLMCVFPFAVLLKISTIYFGVLFVPAIRTCAQDTVRIFEGEFDQYRQADISFRGEYNEDVSYTRHIPRLFLSINPWGPTLCSICKPTFPLMSSWDRHPKQGSPCRFERGVYPPSFQTKFQPSYQLEDQFLSQYNHCRIDVVKCLGK